MLELVNGSLERGDGFHAFPRLREFCLLNIDFLDPERGVGSAPPRTRAGSCSRQHASLTVMNRLGMHLERRACQADLGLKNPEIEVLIYALENPRGSA